MSFYYFKHTSNLQVGNIIALEMLREGADVILQKAKAQNSGSS
jgi:hypothetical protein